MSESRVVNRRRLSIVVFVLATLLVSVAAVTAQGPKPQSLQAAVGPGFTYQGQLKISITPFNGSCNVQFSLWDAQGSGSPPSGGTQMGGTQTVPSVPVTNGLFTAVVNNSGQFGASAFSGQERWLQVAVQCGSDPGYTALSRQLVTATPYALYAIGNWGLNGNTGTNANNFLGTTDNMSLTLSVSNTAALRLIPNPNAPILIGGFSGNQVGGAYDGATIGGGGSSIFGGNIISGSNVSWSTIGGGVNNRILGNAYNATIGGGFTNLISGTASDAGRSVIAGGYNNSVTSNSATVGGGQSNRASGDFSTVSGGRSNTASGPNSIIACACSTIGGGDHNTASNFFSAVGGGQSNTASGIGAFVGGGGYDGFNFNIGGNVASGNASTVGGGLGNTASNFFSAVGGGVVNTASGYGSMVPGGNGNVSGAAYSFAAGWNARAIHDGAFVWADTANLAGTPITSTARDQFLVRASGGVTMYTNPGATVGATLAPNSGSWSVLSDRNAKMNFNVVDGRAVLAQLASISVETWSYKTQDPTIRHMGPMAQDFHAAFGVGENDTSISTVDAQGVALAAIQGLNELVQEKDARIAALEERVSALEQQHAGSATAPHTGLSLELPLMAGMFGLNLALGALVVVYARRAQRA